MPICGKRARTIKAGAGLEASSKLTQGALEMEKSPIAPELRRRQLLPEIGIGNHSSTVVLIPSAFTNAAARSFIHCCYAGNFSYSRLRLFLVAGCWLLVRFCPEKALKNFKPETRNQKPATRNKKQTA